MSLGTVVIGGGTGFVGTALTNTLKKLGCDTLLVSRKPGANVLTWTHVADHGLPPNCSAVFSLAGQNVLDPFRRWTPGFKQNVYASRVHTTQALADAVKKMEVPPKVFISISGVGYYKPDAVTEYTEDSPGGDHDFLADLCVKWENASVLPPEHNVRRVVVRSGVVLGHNGGMIKQLYWPFYFGVGGPIGDGKQFMPWIHVEDLVGIFIHAMTHNSVSGILNGVSPEVITNGEFTKEFAHAMWRPAFIPLPKFALELAFSHERAVMMTEGQKVIPKRTLESGYQFKYPDIKSAVREIVQH
ncbi:epimerase family protein SDR39U1-like [Ornithodoros turicata]|uniref:epimerase family protein SDR39U1-like n=1 Tax=Ornithodoros turicata TaxID=34597 RepID=UPI003139EDF0